MKRYLVAGLAIILSIMRLMIPTAAIAENPAEHYLTNMYDGSLVNTGKDNGYTGASPINANDVHYSWTLGQFVLSGYTEITKEDSIPVVLVNPGDTISLSYKLWQNIDALNGQGGLSISEDTDGYDEAFQIEKTNFGRGALFVKCTDHSNNSRVTPYLDYLTSVQEKKANATISDLEEGDYEVALDYEIAEAKWPGHKYHNYRTTFQFKIRNSSCMVFVRDLETKDEYANFSVAENGFFLDKASYYQSVVVERQYLTDNGYGYSLTPRINRAAYDGAEYTEPGIYTVTAKNKYTDETVEMTIAVGSEQITNAYVTANCAYKPEEISEMVANGVARITDDWRIEMIEKPEPTPEPAQPAIAPATQIETDGKTIDSMTETIITAVSIAFVMVIGIAAAIMRKWKKTK